MNRWVLLEHKVPVNKLLDIHYDFLIEDKIDCLTWKFKELPTFKKGFIHIERQINHRLVWLLREEYKLTENRGFVKRIDYGTFKNISRTSDFKLVKLKLKGKILNGVLEINGNYCRLL
tara:strand:- start:159 stop:512 length:354 start_codon:yes stop_codon:yes gene_type:complete